MSVRRMNEDDIFALGTFIGLLLKLRQQHPDLFDYTVWHDEEGIYTDFIDIKVMGRTLRLTVSTDNDLRRDDLRDDLVALRDELGES